MAPRKSRRSAAAAPPPEAPPAEESDSALSEAEESPVPPSPTQVRGQATGLKFNDTLLGRPGRPIPVATLLQRLRTLADELKALDQAESDDFKESCKPVAKELSDGTILGHKDKGVRAFAAQCIVDLLALCAPDAPFNTQALKAAFDLIIGTVFPALADPTHAYNVQHVYVLDSLADVKSILLIQDLPNANKLMTQLFTTFFDIYGGTARSSTSDEPINKHVEFNMLNIMVTLIDEAESLPQEVVDIVVAQFLRADPKLFGQREDRPKKGEKTDERQTTLARKELPTPYLAAKNICTMVPEKMAREISKYFSDVIVSASGANGSGSKGKGTVDIEDMEDSVMGPSEEDMQELEKAHRLVRELWRACPPVLQSVVPQLEAELAAENTQLRVLATETIGDMISGIGASGILAPVHLDPAAYPPLSLSRPAESAPFDPLTTPASPQSFPQTHPQAYGTFFGRRQDKAPLVRSAWSVAAGRILQTSAGGVGLNHAEEKRLVEELARMINDNDEKVRIATVKAVGAFNCHDAVNKLCIVGGIDQEGSVLHNLGSHIKDKRHPVRVEAVQTLARFWAAAHGEIAEKNEQVISAMGSIPKLILDAFYVNHLDIQELVETTLFEILVPLGYPPLKSKGKDKSNGASQRAKDTQVIPEEEDVDPDHARAERFLVFANSLDQRGQNVLWAFAQRQAAFSKYVSAYLKCCEAYNGGVMDSEEDTKEANLSKIIDLMAKLHDERQRVHADLWKFAKTHDRRNYNLIRFCLEPKSDYRTIIKAKRELEKRVSESANPNLLETFIPLLYRSALILYNRSHVPAILKFSKTNEKGLAHISNLVLKDISEKSPAVLETDIQEMCQGLQDSLPSPGHPNHASVLDNLKACAAFSRGYPHKLPKDRKFIQALSAYTLYGSPPEAGKHAVSIILGASEKKGPAAKDILKRCLKGFQYGQEGFLTRLASMSQVMLLAPEEANDHQEQVFAIVMEDILTKVRTPATEKQYIWTTELDEECAAKCWAIKVLVNRIRSYSDKDTLKEVADPILATLSLIVASEGDLSPAKDTPATHKPQLRLLAAQSLMKICRSLKHEALLDSLAFAKLAEVAQDGLFPVRDAFLRRIRKYATRNTLPPRWYTTMCLVAYEPDSVLKTEMGVWLKQRAQAGALQTDDSTNKKPKSGARTTMEAMVARLISLLAHHPDYDDSASGLLEMAQYLLFYLNAVANADNISLIYHIAQRVKAHRDAVLDSSTSTFAEKIKPEVRSTDFDKRLHTLSDLCCAAIRNLVEVHDWSLQSLPGRANLPRNLFKEIKVHDEAINIAETNFLAEGLVEKLDVLIRELLRKRSKPDPRKRKSEANPGGDGDEAPAKRAKRASTAKAKAERTPKSTTKKTKTPKRRGNDWESDDDESTTRNPQSEKDRRKSGRNSSAVKYIEREDDEDDQEMLNGVAEWEYENGERQKDEKDEDDDDESDTDDEEQVEDEEEDENEEEVDDAPAEPQAKGAGGDKDIEMTDDNDAAATEDDEPTSSPPSPVSSPPATKRGKGAAKAKNAKSSNAKGTPKPTEKTRGGRAEGKTSKATTAAAKSTEKTLPTRSGRATRSAAGR